MDILKSIIVDAISFKTKTVNNATADKKWVVVDAEGQTLGRFASKVAMILRGKHKPSFTPNSDCGDNVIIINADKVKLSGKKWAQKEYISHSGYPGGQKRITPKELIQKKPYALVEKAVKGMLPKNRIGADLYRNLFVYAGTDHPHAAQKPEKIELN